jgi:hypothetical protein
VTDVAWDKAGNAFISDGYINSRIAKVDKDGAWLKSWGERGTGPGQFRIPHSIAVAARGLVYVADRSNRRIQVFDGDGRFQRQFTIDAPAPRDAKPAIGDMPGEAEIAAGTFAPGSPWAICFSPPPDQVLYVSDAFPGRIYKLTPEGKLLGMLGRSGKQLKQAGFTRWPARPRTCSTWPSFSTGGCRSFCSADGWICMDGRATASPGAAPGSRSRQASTLSTTRKRALPLIMRS